MPPRGIARPTRVHNAAKNPFTITTSATPPFATAAIPATSAPTATAAWASAVAAMAKAIPRGRKRATRVPTKPMVSTP